MDRCPACRARLLNQAVCPRCACDFSLAQEAQASARRHLSAAVQALALGDRAAAAQALQQSLALKKSDMGRALVAQLQQ